MTCPACHYCIYWWTFLPLYHHHVLLHYRVLSVMCELYETFHSNVEIVIRHYVA